MLVSAGRADALLNGFNDATNAGTVTPTVDQICLCNDGTAVDCLSATSSSCGPYGFPKVYLRVDADGAFNTFAAYPLIPNVSPIERRAWIRVR